MIERFSHHKNTKNYQRQLSSGGPTTYIKPRHTPPPVPRRLPRPKSGPQRQQSYTHRNTGPALPPRKPPQAPYRLYSISEKEEEHGEHLNKRKIMDEQKSKYKSEESLLSKTSQAGLTAQQTDINYGSMPDVSAAGNLKQEEDQTEMNKGSKESLQAHYSFLGTEPQFASTPTTKGDNSFSFNNINKDILSDQKGDEGNLHESVTSDGVKVTGSTLVQSMDEQTTDKEILHVSASSDMRQREDKRLLGHSLIGTESIKDSTLYQTAVSSSSKAEQNLKVHAAEEDQVSNVLVDESEPDLNFQISETEQDRKVQISEAEQDPKLLVSKDQQEQHINERESQQKVKVHAAEVEQDSNIIANESEHDPKVHIIEAEQDTQVQSSEAEQDTKVQVSEKEQDTKVQFSEAEQDTNVQNSEAEQDTKVQISEAEQDLKVQVSESEQDTKFLVSKDEQKQHIQESEAEQNLKVHATEVEQDSNVLVSESEQDPNVQISEAEQDAKVQITEGEQDLKVQVSESEQDPKFLVSKYEQEQNIQEREAEQNPNVLVYEEQKQNVQEREAEQDPNVLVYEEQKQNVQEREAEQDPNVQVNEAEPNIKYKNSEAEQNKKVQVSRTGQDLNFKVSATTHVGPVDDLFSAPKNDDEDRERPKPVKPSDSLLKTDSTPLKTVDSVSQYFTKPTDLLKRKLKPQLLKDSKQEIISTHTAVEPHGHDDSTTKIESSSTKVVKYEEKLFKEIIDSKLQQQGRVDQGILPDFTSSVHQPQLGSLSQNQSDSGIDSKLEQSDTEMDNSKTKEMFLRKTQSEAQKRKSTDNKERTTRSLDSAVGYDSRHDFTSIVEFLEVLKLKEDEGTLGKSQAISAQTGHEETVDIRDQKQDIIDNTPSAVGRRMQKYMPAVPSPLTYIPDILGAERVTERKEENSVTQSQGKMHADITSSKVTMDQLLRDKVQTTSSEDHTPNYGEIENKSSLELEKKINQQVVADSLNYSTPSKLLAKGMTRDAQERGEQSPGYGEFDYTTPSKLGMDIQNKKMTDPTLNYCTPSKLLAKVMTREAQERGERSPGYGEFDYTTPSKLGMDIQNQKMTDPTLNYCTPSKLLAKVMTRDAQERGERSPGYGEFDYTTPSKLGMENQRTTDSTERIDTLIANDSVRQTPDKGPRSHTEVQSRDHGNILPSASQKMTYSPVNLKNTGYGDSRTSQQKRSPGGKKKYNTKPVTTRKRQGQENMVFTGNEKAVNGKIFDMFPTPSKLLEKVEMRERREKREKFQGYGVLEYTTPSKLLNKYKAEKKRKDDLNIPTVSQLLKKVETREARARKKEFPGYGTLDYITPSKMIGINQLDKEMDNVEQRRNSHSERTCPENAKSLTISQLFEGVRKGKDGSQVQRPSLDGTFSHATPEFVLKKFSFGDSKISLNQEKSSAASKQSNKKLSERQKHLGHGKDMSLVPAVSSDNASERFIALHRIMSAPDRVCSSEYNSETKEAALSKEVKHGEGHEKDQKAKQSSRQDGRKDTNILPMHSDITAYVPKRPSDEDEQYPYKRHRSEPEFFGSFQDMSKLSMIDNDDGEGSYDVKSTEYLGSLPKSLRSSDSSVSSEEGNERLKSRLMQQQSDISSAYPSTLYTFKDRDSFMISNPSFEEVSPEESMLSMESVHMEDFLGDTASINQLFWSLYSSHPNLMKYYLDSNTRTPSQAALESLSDLYRTAVNTLASRTEDDQGRYSGGAQKKRTLPTSPTSTTPDVRSFFMEKEVMESQNRKLQMEISTLSTENKLLKEKYNRATAKIKDLEEELNETKEELESLQLSVHHEVSSIERKSKSEVAQDIEQLNNKITSLVHENEALKSEVLHLETQLQTASGVVDMARQNNEKNKTVEAYKMEVTSLKDEVTRVKSLLEQSEHHLHEEENRYRESSQQVIKLTEMKNLLQQQVELGGGGNTVVDKQIKSLEKRLRVTEERLHQERSDRANNLSQVEDKLLTENARLQAAEKELGRQLQREKDKNRNLEQKIKDVRNENERLRLQVPFDETSLTSEKYDIPYSTHSSQRQESVKNHDFKHIATRLEQESGLRSERDMVCHLWSTREQAYYQLRQWEIMLQDLNLRDNDVTEGLKNLRDLRCQYEMKLKQAEEKVEDYKSEKMTFETTYKEQLAMLVKERHEAFAKLKTAEDLLEATRSENEILRKNLPALSVGGLSLQGKDTLKESLQIQVQNLDSKVLSLTRANQVLEGEITTLKVQMESRDKTLKDVESELELANSKLELDKSDDRKQQKIDKLTVRLNTSQAEIGLLNDKYQRLLSDNRSLEKEIETARKDVIVFKTKQKEMKNGEMADSKMSFSVREELEDKSRQINTMAEELHKLDSALQQSRQDLYQEQIQSNDYESQLESVQQQFEERGRIIDAISEAEREQLAQYKVLKVTLDSVNSELKDKEGKVKILEVELSQHKDKLQQLERKLLSQDGAMGEIILPGVEMERDQLKLELLESLSRMKTAEEEMQEMATEIQQLQQEVTNQKSELLQLSSEKGELEQHLEEIAEEHDALIQEKAQSEGDIIKLENKLQELVETLENEARKQHDNFETPYADIPPEYRGMAEELDTLRSLLEAKDKELDMFQIKASRQQMDAEFLQRRIELLHNDNQSNREDIARMTNQLIIKMKEGMESRQLTEYLSGERLNLQKEVTQLEHNLEKERNLQTTRQAEVEKSEFSKKESVISSLEKSLEQVRKTLQDTEYENVQLRYKIESLTDDQRKMTTINSSLESKMEAERKMYEERQQEVMSLNHKLDLLQREHDHVLNNLNTEKQVKEKLNVYYMGKNNDYQIYSSENHNLRQEILDIQRELEDCQRQLLSSKETQEKVRQDKGIMYHEYENMVKRLSEKDQKIIELQIKLDITIADMEKELHLQKHTHEMEKTSTERELDIQREQVTSLNAEVKSKQMELSTFGRTLQELEEVNKHKKDLENELLTTRGSVHELKLLLENHKKEIKSLHEALARHQETVSKTQLEKAGVEHELHKLKESTAVTIQELNKRISEMKNSNEGEKYYLKDNLSQTQSKLQSLESSLSSAIQSRDKLQVECRMLQRSVEESKENLQAETTSRKVAEQRAETLDSQLHESRKDRFLTEEKWNQSQVNVARLERELKSEKDKLKTSIETNQELEAKAYSHESTAKSKQEQIDILQNEVRKLKQILEGQKVQLNSKLKKSAQDMSQQMELIELDRNKLSQQNTQLFNDLEKSRETVQSKNKENLKLQEEILQLNEQVKEFMFKLKNAEESLKAEEELQSKLHAKLQEQDEELKKVKNFLTKKAEESGDAEKSVWNEMNKMILDMSKQMSLHLESQKASDKDTKDRDSKTIQRYKKQIHDLNTELQTERALHKITASSLQSLEEDCIRLRQQCQAMRRRNNSASDKKYKSRMEAINEIIARSQTQAQVMLSSGNYLDDTMKSLASPRVTFDNSPDNSISSDMSFNSTIAVINDPSPSRPMKSTPRKS